MFSCEFCEIYKITFFTEHLLAVASYKYYLCTVFMLAEFVLFQNCKSFQVNTEPYVTDIYSSQTNSRDLVSDYKQDYAILKIVLNTVELLGLVIDEKVTKV